MRFYDRPVPGYERHMYRYHDQAPGPSEPVHNQPRAAQPNTTTQATTITRPPTTAPWPTPAASDTANDADSSGIPEYASRVPPGHGFWVSHPGVGWVFHYADTTFVDVITRFVPYYVPHYVPYPVQNDPNGEHQQETQSTETTQANQQNTRDKHDTQNKQA
ncbi:Fc.00g100880.m01.CDS01 [Cosmosporella sp. VM-42]